MLKSCSASVGTEDDENREMDVNLHAVKRREIKLRESREVSVGSSLCPIVVISIVVSKMLTTRALKVPFDHLGYIIVLFKVMLAVVFQKLKLDPLSSECVISSSPVDGFSFVVKHNGRCFPVTIICFYKVINSHHWCGYFFSLLAFQRQEKKKKCLKQNL